MKWHLFAITFFVTCTSQSQAAPVPRRFNPATMDNDERAQFQRSMDGNATLWDQNTRLLHSPQYVPGKRYPGNYIDDHHYFERCCSKVRETSSYALALLLRDAPGDRQRAAEALDAVLKNQYVTTGVRWFGTFKRTPEEPDPGPGAQIWQDYDPNWREFIGTNFEIILIEYPDRISPDLARRLYKSIDLAVEGEKLDGRLFPSYTNPALMYGALWDFAAAHEKRADWRKQSLDWIESVYKLFKQYNSFYEYNSPSYYGVDLFALALWRKYGSTEHIQAMGGDMEATLWRTIAEFYQPDLHNLAGPYDRSYGMDMESPGHRTAGGIIELTRYAVDEKGVPIPGAAKLAGPGFSFAMAILGTRIPADALTKLQHFEEEHMVRRQITDQRVATAWIGKQVIFGGEATKKTKDVGKNSQYHPIAIQWRTPSGEIGWVQVAFSPMIDATADEHGLTISTTGTIRLRIHAKGLVPGQLTQSMWNLPGLHVAVAADSQGTFRVEEPDATINQYFLVTDDMVDLVYPGITRMRLEIKVEADKR